MTHSTQSLEEAVRHLLDQYFADLDGAPASPLYEMVIRRVERTLFDYLLIRTHGNISQSAELLGITRNTLRRKLKELDLYTCPSIAPKRESP